MIVWPEAYRKYEARIASDEPIYVAGKLEVGEDRCQIIADEVGALADMRFKNAKEVCLVFQEGLTAERAEALSRALQAHPGTRTVTLQVMDEGIVANVRLPRFKVSPNEKLADADRAARRPHQLHPVGAGGGAPMPIDTRLSRRRRRAGLPELDARRRDARRATASRPPPRRSRPSNGTPSTRSTRARAASST